MANSKTKFGTMLDCMDGRTQEVVTDWMKKEFGLDAIDAPNPAGPTKMILSGKKEIVDHYKKEVLISINEHHSKHLAVVAHHDCAANPISDVEQKSQIKSACEVLLREWDIPVGVRVIGLWLSERNDLDWQPHKVFDKYVLKEEK